MNTPHRVLALVTAVLLMSGCGSGSGEGGADRVETSEPEIAFREDGRLTLARDGEPYIDLAIEIAETDSTRTRGMMQRTSVPDHSGMLFIFETEEDRAFWMANTPLSLDLIFISADSTIITIKKYMQPLSPQNVPSEGPAQYVLEVVAGYSDTIGIIEGDRVSWTRTSAASDAQ